MSAQGPGSARSPGVVRPKCSLTSQLPSLRSTSFPDRSQSLRNSQFRGDEIGERFGRAIARPSIEGTSPRRDRCGREVDGRLAGQLPGPPLKGAIMGT